MMWCALGVQGGKSAKRVGKHGCADALIPLGVYPNPSKHSMFTEYLIGNCLQATTEMPLKADA